MTALLKGCSGDALRERERPSSSTPRAVPGLPEPLVATKPTTREEDAALAAATEGRDGKLQPLIDFVGAHPDSGWNAAIHSNLGLAYYCQGYFSRALEAFETAWREGRSAKGLLAKRLAHGALGELAKMHARVGHLAEPDRLLGEVSAIGRERWLWRRKEARD